MPLPDRDYATDMSEVIDSFTKDTPYDPRVVAEKIVAFLMERDADLLFGWLMLQAEYFLWQTINSRARSVRHTSRNAVRREKFKDAADKFEKTGDSSGLRAIINMPITVPDGVKRLRNLNKFELTWAADRYSVHASRNAMMAAFLNALAAKLGDNLTVEEVYSPEQIDEMFRSLDAAQPNPLLT